MVDELDNVGIPVLTTMAPPDLLTPLDRYLNSLELAAGANALPLLRQGDVEDALSPATAMEQGETREPPRIGGALSMPAPLPPPRLRTSWALTSTPEQEGLDYSPGPGVEMLTRPVISPLPPSPPNRCLSLEDITPEDSPNGGLPYPVPQNSSRGSFSPATGSWDTLDSWEMPGFGIDM